MTKKLNKTKKHCRLLQRLNVYRDFFRVSSNHFLSKDKDLYDHLIEFDAILVLFHRSSCLKSRQFLPQFESAARDLIMYEPHISSGKIDCDKGGKITCANLKVIFFG